MARPRRTPRHDGSARDEAPAPLARRRPRARVARWIRESTAGQYDRYGPASQREQQDRFIDRHGLVDTGLVFQVAHSGTTVWRSATMAEMLAEARAGAFDLLLAGYSDRWQRNLRRTLELLEDGLHPAGVALVMCDRRILSLGPARLGRARSARRPAPRSTAAACPSGSPTATPRSSTATTTRAATRASASGACPSRRTPSRSTPTRSAPRSRLFERYALGNVSAKDLAAETGLAETADPDDPHEPALQRLGPPPPAEPQRDRKPAPWRADPPVSDELWARVEEVRPVEDPAAAGRAAADRVDLLGGPPRVRLRAPGPERRHLRRRPPPQAPREPVRGLGKRARLGDEVWRSRSWRRSRASSSTRRPSRRSSPAWARAPVRWRSTGRGSSARSATSRWSMPPAASTTRPTSSGCTAARGQGQPRADQRRRSRRSGPWPGSRRCRRRGARPTSRGEGRPAARHLRPDHRRREEDRGRPAHAGGLRARIGAGAARKGCSGAPDRIRTCDLRLRRPTLYPLSYRRAGLRHRAAGPESTTGHHARLPATRRAPLPSTAIQATAAPGHGGVIPVAMLRPRQRRDDPGRRNVPASHTRAEEADGREAGVEGEPTPGPVRGRSRGPQSRAAVGAAAGETGPESRSGSLRSRFDAVPVKNPTSGSPSATQRRHLSRRLNRLP